MKKRIWRSGGKVRKTFHTFHSQTLKTVTAHNSDLGHALVWESGIENRSPSSGWSWKSWSWMSASWSSCLVRFLRSAPCRGARGATGAAAPRWSRFLHTGSGDPAGSEQDGAPSDLWPLPRANITGQGTGWGQRSRSAGCSHWLRSGSWLRICRDKKINKIKRNKKAAQVLTPCSHQGLYSREEQGYL